MSERAPLRFANQMPEHGRVLGLFVGAMFWDTNGIFHVSAQDKAIGNEQRIHMGLKAQLEASKAGKGKKPMSDN